MTWSRRFRIRESARGSLWLVPLVGALSGAVLAAVVSELEHSFGAFEAWTYSPGTANTVLTAIIGAVAALTGFVVTVTVLAVQMAAGTFSPRYMRLWYRDGMLKAALALLVGSLTFSLALLRRIEEDFVPNLGVTIAGLLVALSVILFLFFFDRVIHRLRPVAVTALASRAGVQSFRALLVTADQPEILFTEHAMSGEPALRVRAGRAGALQAVDTDGLVRWARERDALVVLVRAVGDFVPEDGALMDVYGTTVDPMAAEHELRGMAALGTERTIQQDPAFALRIMVDIAIRALSPAVNDPTTAVQVLNHLGEILRVVGTTDLGGRGRAAGGVEPRLVMRIRGWDDYLALGLTEIRQYGADSVQVVRRLRALLEELHPMVRPEHGRAVEDELSRLDATVRQQWDGAIDEDRARLADGQGIGGPSAAPRSSSSERG